MRTAPTHPEVYKRFRPGHTQVWQWLIEGRHLSGPNVLDIGCGPGVEASTLAQSTPLCAYVGIDIAFDAVDFSKKTLGNQQNCSFVVASAEKLPFSDNSFDLVTFFLSLHQIDTPEIALLEAIRVMSPGGAVGVLVVEKNDWQKAIEYDCFPGLNEIEEAKSGQIDTKKVETWFADFGLTIRRAKFQYIKQYLNQNFLEACRNMYFSSLKRLNKQEFDEGIHYIEERIAASSVTETRDIFCTVLEGSKK